MKGFVFTLDAVFSLVFAAVAISALVYVSYSGYMPVTVQSSELSSIASTLTSTGLQALGQTSPLYGAGSQGSWPQYGADEGFSFGSAHGPTGPYLLYSYTAASNIIPAAVANGGYVAFAAGTQLYELNATTGAPAYNYPVTSGSNLAAPPVYYRNTLIYANIAGNLYAVSTSNGLSQLWQTNIAAFGRFTTPLDIEDGYLVFGVKNGGSEQVYFIDPANGTVVEHDPTSVGGTANDIAWIAHHKGEYYAGIWPSKSFNSIVRNEYVNSSFYPSNSFASYGNFSVVDNLGTAAMYGNLTAYYSKASNTLNLTGVPYYNYAHQFQFTVPSSKVNTTPSIGGNTTYLLDNGIYFLAFNQGGQLFNVTLPYNPVYFYNYSDIALAYGNAYLEEGSTLYAFGTGGYLQQNSSLLTALGDLYLTGRGGLADYVLYNTYGGAGNIGIFINKSYGPSLHVAKFNGLSSSLQIPNVALLQLSTLTITGWVNFAGPSPGYWNWLVAKQGAWGVGGCGSATVVLCYYDWGSSVEHDSAFTMNTNTWYFVAAVISGGTEIVYVNGTQELNGPMTISSQATSGVDIGYGNWDSQYLNGQAADIQIYNTALNQQNISSIYQRGAYGAPVNTLGLVGWWPLLGDGNDYSGSDLVAFPTNMLYTTSNYIPASFSKSVQIGSSSIPLQLTNNGISKIYNVSVVVWTS